jgi:DNA-binding NtrC family response regulator
LSAKIDQDTSATIFQPVDCAPLRAQNAGPAHLDAPLHHSLQAVKILALALLSELEYFAEPSVDRTSEFNLADEVRRFEIELIRCALLRTGGRQRRAARLLGIKIATLNAKIKRYQLDVNDIARTATELRLRHK